MFLGGNRSISCVFTVPSSPLFLKQMMRRKPHTLFEYLYGQKSKKKKHPLHFRKNTPRENQKSRELFSFLGCRMERSGGGAIRRAYDFGQSHHAPRTCDYITDFGNRFVCGAGYENWSQVFSLCSKPATPPRPPVGGLRPSILVPTTKQ